MADSSVASYFIVGVTLLVGLLFLAFLVSAHFDRALRRKMKKDMFSKWSFIICHLYLLNYIIYWIGEFLPSQRHPKNTLMTLKEIWSERDTTFQMIELESIDLPGYKAFTNFTGIINLHLIHCAMGLYFLMLVCILKYKSVLDSNHIEQMFTKLHSQMDWQPTIRDLTQTYIYKTEIKYLTFYYLYLSLTLISFLCWVLSQFLDFHILRSSSNPYFKSYISWFVNSSLRNFLLLTNFWALVGYIGWWVGLNVVVLGRLRRSVNMAYRMYGKQMLVSCFSWFLSVLLLVGKE
jgi:hypothetical protein